MQQESSRLKDHAHQAWLAGHSLALYRALPDFSAEALLIEHNSWLE
jgi:hypothetical protein